MTLTCKYTALLHPGRVFIHRSSHFLRHSKRPWIGQLTRGRSNQVRTRVIGARGRHIRCLDACVDVRMQIIGHALLGAAGAIVCTLAMTFDNNNYYYIFFYYFQLGKASTDMVRAPYAGPVWKFFGRLFPRGRRKDVVSTLCPSLTYELHSADAVTQKEHFHTGLK